MADGKDDDLERRQAEHRAAIDRLDTVSADAEPERKTFFTDVYRHAGGDAGMVPWADLAPKQRLAQWLARHDGTGRRAVDIACGLGDNAEALADAGYETTAFDLSQEAIDWARQRFPESSVNYTTADMFALPDEWHGAFDVVHECYTLQALPPQMLSKTAAAVASLVRPGGTLLVYAIWRPDSADVDGPPWPLRESDLYIFQDLGLDLRETDFFTVARGDRDVPHAFFEWQRR